MTKPHNPKNTTNAPAPETPATHPRRFDAHVRAMLADAYRMWLNDTDPLALYIESGDDEPAPAFLYELAAELNVTLYSLSSGPRQYNPPLLSTLNESTDTNRLIKAGLRDSLKQWRERVIARMTAEPIDPEVPELAADTQPTNDIPDGPE